jgi:SP family arabinose:H+ symporter-like MFS transporter
MNRYLVKGSAVAALGGLLFGFDTAVIAGATEALKTQYSLTPAALGLTVSAALFGTIAGAMFGGIPGDRYGRRISLRFTAILYLISALGCAFAFGWYSFLGARFIGGLGIGASSVLGPMYIAEIAPAKLRGRLVGFFQFNIVFGILAAYLSNYLIGTMGFGDVEWRWKLGISAVPAALFLAMLFFIAESPRWLAKQGRVKEAEEVLRSTGDPNYREDLKEIVTRWTNTGRGQRAVLLAQIRPADFSRRFHRYVQPALGHQRHSLLPERHLRQRPDSARSRAICNRSRWAPPT